jgi:uncharacterized protein YlxW (UPF0749 family)
MEPNSFLNGMGILFCVFLIGGFILLIIHILTCVYNAQEKVERLSSNYTDLWKEGNRFDKWLRDHHKDIAQLQNTSKRVNDENEYAREIREFKVLDRVRKLESATENLPIISKNTERLDMRVNNMQAQIHDLDNLIDDIKKEM